MSEIIYKSKNAVVINKPVGISSQPDRSGAGDAMTSLSEQLSALGESGSLYPVHRLDNVVGGLIVYARSKKAASELSSLIKELGIGKEYYAVIEGCLPDGEYSDYLVKDTLGNRARICGPTDRDAKLATLTFKALASVETKRGIRSLVKVILHTGRFHQIRAQLSSRGAAIIGDSKYGSRDFMTRTPALFSCAIKANFLGEDINLHARPSLDKYPWNLFSAENYI